jgi:poly(hydroxyalkanoate) depolymerase family esterase
MARLGRTVAGLSRYRREWAKLFEGVQRPERAIEPEEPSRLREVKAFGANPGNLRMLAYAPETLAASPALVVVLHGCTQTAAAYDRGTGWSTLADRHGFALLFPEQKRANNPKTCFNWFEPGDTARDAGEALSIRNMVERMVRDRGIDRSRIYVTGLSAGGAMANVMLAAYPEVFAGGAIIAGLPYWAAGSVREAFDAMFRGASRTGREWGDLVRAASRHEGPWPKVSVWHGSGDKVVVPMNAGEIVKQWADVHRVAGAPARERIGPAAVRQVWRDGAGLTVLESITIDDMAHGTPLSAGEGDERCGVAGPFLLDVGLSSTHHIARFWGLVEERPARRVSPKDIVRPPGAAKAEPPEEAANDVGAVITKALRAAGLMR